MSLLEFCWESPLIGSAWFSTFVALWLIFRASILRIPSLSYCIGHQETLIYVGQSPLQFSLSSFLFYPTYIVKKDCSTTKWVFRTVNTQNILRFVKNSHVILYSAGPLKSVICQLVMKIRTILSSGSRKGTFVFFLTVEKQKFLLI